MATWKRVAFNYLSVVLNDPGHANGSRTDICGARYKMRAMAIHKLIFAIQLIFLLCRCIKTQILSREEYNSNRFSPIMGFFCGGPIQTPRVPSSA
jgi:hypothetical protein